VSEALNVISGRKSVPTGSAQQITTTSQVIAGASVKALDTNPGGSKVYIGPQGVTANDYYLVPDESIEFDIVDLVNVYVLGTTSGLVVVFFGLKP
jgi:hypothetical protein